MLAPFPTHVLSVTPEGVRELDGREALSKLWTLFSKCKESIENGRRLENISWRLWYRDMLATIPLDLSESRVGLDGLLKDCETLDEKAYRPPTPMETLLPPPDVAAHFQTLSLGAASPTLASPPTVPRSVPPMLRTRTESFRKPLKPLPVGQIIYDMLPNSSAMAHSPRFFHHLRLAIDVLVLRRGNADSAVGIPRPTTCLISLG
ncbi:hypothetical protein DFP72DRAFT_1121954 [Ephemerocybe angulata]|uniref:Nitrogen regulatory protein areA GATA-like domain-containing protein n=1 Tax=Ephemerocybe angulata TaxID=980116 RepID=A0A8H6M5E3_9AGAR|nr:hypothetical protein DFP72DRAFT_1121954 [Tulosesus angulatus]